MNSLKYYRSLPDFMSVEDIKKELQVFYLDHVRTDGQKILSAMEELSSRYVDSLGKLSIHDKKQLADKVLHLWSPESLESTELVLTIIINFELFGAYQHLKKIMPKIRSQEVVKELIDTFKELGNWGN